MTEQEVLVKGANILEKIENCKHELSMLDAVKNTKISKKKKKALRERIGVLERQYVRVNQKWYRTR